MHDCFKFVCINDCCVYWVQSIKHTSRFSKKSWEIHCDAITWWHHPESAICSRRKCFLSIISNEIFCPDLILECYWIILLLSDVVVRWNQIHFSLLKSLTVKFPQWGDSDCDFRSSCLSLGFLAFVSASLCM